MSGWVVAGRSSASETGRRRASIGSTGSLVVESRCRAGRRCVSNHPPAITHSPLCAYCVNDIQRCVDELPHLLGALAPFKNKSSGSGLELRIRFTKDPPCPLNVNVVALIDLIQETMDRAGGWGVRVIELMHEPAYEYPVWDGDTQIIRELNGVDRALSIRRIHARVSKIVGLERTKQSRPAPCPHCNGKLWNWVGESTVQCTHCPDTMTIDAYESYCLELLEDYQ